MNNHHRDFTRKIEDFAPFAEMMPAVVIIHQLEPFSTVYMSSRGLRELGITLRELETMGTDYMSQFFNLEETEEFYSKMKNLIQNQDPAETFTFFQQVKFAHRQEWLWHLGASRIFFQDEKGVPTHLITLALPIDSEKHLTNKAERLLAEKNFFQGNLRKFLTLGKRERDVLRLVALGKSSNEIAGDLFISKQTVDTHRKSIKLKLGISSTYDFTLYAHAFDLI